MDTKTVEKLKDLVETYLGKEHQLYEELNGILKEERGEFDLSKLRVEESSNEIIPLANWLAAGFEYSAIEVRMGGEYQNKMLWFNPHYNFKIVTDSRGSSGLLITRKE